LSNCYAAETIISYPGRGSVSDYHGSKGIARGKKFCGAFTGCTTAERAGKQLFPSWETPVAERETCVSTDEFGNYDDLREKFAFHMADVARNLSALAQAYASPTSCDTKCLSERTEMFFYDCMPHLMAAAQIYDEIPQLFEEQKGVHDWSSFVDDEVAG
jgi:hypothetical protein